MTTLDCEGARRFLARQSARHTAVTDWSDWRTFRADSATKQWVYLYRFGRSVFAWGTTTGSSDRLRRACMFHRSLTGKYDRRVDYLMLKVIYGMPDVWVFEGRSGERATHLESALRARFGQSHCYRGLDGNDRKEISRNILTAFRRTPRYRGLPDPLRDAFERFMSDVFFAFRRHPKNQKRTFFWGDSLEPGFLRTIGLGTLEPAVAAALDVEFPVRRRSRATRGVTFQCGNWCE